MEEKTKFYAISSEEALKKVNSSLEGLKSADAELRLQANGKNELPQKNKISTWKILGRELVNPIMILLMFATLFSLIVGEWIDAVVIFLLIAIDLTLGTIQEKRAHRIASSLVNMVKTNVKVLRDGEKTQVDAKNLVVGDIVFLESGDKISADMRILTCSNLKVDESLLTGESTLVEKQTETMAENTGLADRKNMLFAGASVMTGRAVAVVVETGINTEIGKIADTLDTVKNEKSPLDMRIKKFSTQITIGICIVALVIFIALWFQGNDFNTIFLFVIAMAVSAIPEGLPLAVTMALTVSSNKMSKKNVIVKNLKAVESLGSCTVIASDKTGTLTLNEQTAKIIALPNGDTFEVTGSGYNDNGKIVPKKNAQIEFAKEIAKLGALNNEAKLYKHNQEFKNFGDSIDVAFLALNMKAGNKKTTAKTLKIIPYESEKKYSAVFFEEDGKEYCTAKGSVEKILSLCEFMQDGDKISNLARQKLLKQHEKLAAEGYRLIALAKGEAKGEKTEESISGLTFLGFVGFIDPIRIESKSAVESCHTAGIKVIMITGDHPLTAFAIAKEIKIADSFDQVATGAEVEEHFAKGSKEFIKFIRGKKVFSRVTPTDKLNIVNALKKMGEFVAVTGDGVNDAPAIKTAHIGIAMGSGTDVAKETADMIIADDNFSSIVQGIKEGRTAYSNIRKVTYFLLSQGIGELFFFFISILCGLPLPLIAIQLLYLNIVTDGLQDFALVFEKSEDNIMKQSPRSTKESLFSKSLFKESILSGLVIGVLVLGVWIYLIKVANVELELARTIVMTLMVFLQNWHTLNCKSETESIFKTNIFQNPLVFISIALAIGLQFLIVEVPPIAAALGLTSIPFTAVLAMLGIAMVILVVMETYKYFVRRYRKKHNIKRAY